MRLKVTVTDREGSEHVIHAYSVEVTTDRGAELDIVTEHARGGAWQGWAEGEWSKAVLEVIS